MIIAVALSHFFSKVNITLRLTAFILVLATCGSCTKGFNPKNPNTAVLDVKEDVKILSTKITINIHDDVDLDKYQFFIRYSTVGEYEKREGFKAENENSRLYSITLSELKSNTSYKYTLWCHGPGENGRMDDYPIGSVRSFKTPKVEVAFNGLKINKIDDFHFAVQGKLVIQGEEILPARVWVCALYREASLEELLAEGFRKECAILGDGSISAVFKPYDVEHYFSFAFVATVYDQVLNSDILLYYAEVDNTEEVVDLGLSVKWRQWDIGASSIVESGDLYSWNDIVSFNPNIQSSAVPRANTTPGTRSGLQQDPAQIILGGEWRMPTQKECEELLNMCTWRKMILKKTNIVGYVGESPNGNSIFLPSFYTTIYGDIYYGWHQFKLSGFWTSDNSVLYFNHEEQYDYGISSSYEATFPIRPVIP